MDYRYNLLHKPCYWRAEDWQRPHKPNTCVYANTRLPFAGEYSDISHPSAP